MSKPLIALLSLASGIAAICADRWYFGDGGMFYAGLIFLIVALIAVWHIPEPPLPQVNYRDLDL